MNTSLNGGFAALNNDFAHFAIGVAAILVWLVYFAYANLLVYIYEHRDGVPVGATDSLRELWPEVAGFQLFLKETEYVRLQHDTNPTDPSMAYCLALGLDPEFIKSLNA
jgi:hypothetical protein